MSRQGSILIVHQIPSGKKRGGHAPYTRGCREMTAIKRGGMTQNESYHPKFLHKKRWLTITIFFRYML